jgi:hypothetical protein
MDDDSTDEAAANLPLGIPHEGTQLPPLVQRMVRNEPQ